MFIINTKPHNYVRVGSPVIGIPMLYRSKSSDPPGGGGGGGGGGGWTRSRAAIIGDVAHYGILHREKKHMASTIDNITLREP